MILGRLRAWIIRVLAGNSVVILNATIHFSKPLEIDVNNAVISNCDFHIKNIEEFVE